MQVNGRFIHQFTKLHQRIAEIQSDLAQLTPGPWFAANLSGECWELYQDRDDHKRPLCRPRQNPNAEADLRFVAAAPHLVAWLCEQLSFALRELTEAEKRAMSGDVPGKRRRRSAAAAPVGDSGEHAEG